MHSSLQQKGDIVTAVRAELLSQLMLLSANLLSRRGADSSSVSALYVAAFSRDSVSSASTGSMGGELRAFLQLIDKLRAHRLVQAGEW